MANSTSASPITSPPVVADSAASFSSNDDVGHAYGPDSPQVRDIAIRTDRTIGSLLDRVDKIIGLQYTLVAFTTDHGVAPLPKSLGERRCLVDA